MNIQGKTFLISGGASGLGAATARMIVGHGGGVVLLDLDDAAGEAHAIELGETSRFIRTDVTDEDSVKHAVRQSLSEFGSLHGLICCAGVAPGEKVLGKQGPHTLASFLRALQVNLGGTFNTIRLAAEAMRHNEPDAGGERGVVVCTASVAAFDGQIGQAAYAASKAGVVGMTLPIARELAAYGIRVMTIAPGIFETPMLMGLSQQVRESLGTQVPFPPRLGRPGEYAQLVQSIIANPMLNGEVIRLDGAIRMASR
ncbi:3-hydroxyacyl-CoA dehydrogenase [Variovorax sp. J22G21]|uniref:3-hydroxyacyl-CoA dehydrogenase n=1 Tax=Variovorax fucosicus TaxID=3053517 RepID=UPI00257911D8|nr:MULTISPECIES: 3-hydroxyacyl-CoA dehydrogenase [unclassified Variovorax]MDM0037516.1 3-hydroxyacyl-CoA dehydrogenase [Variovorax sp. J22R193]MDM0056814.1 3-hydroxyacyl-CoA dehydrogenase [Variovorax sp. J22G47]MDM0062292.1 3-hydroxyacyl-CoA dehydrogenase [Variovorax sp. J22G21]